MNGIGKVLPVGQSVRTKPGQIVVTRDPAGREVDAQRLEQVELGRLRRAVGLGAGEAAVAGDRRRCRRSAAAAVGSMSARTASSAWPMPIRLVWKWPANSLGVPGLDAGTAPVGRVQHGDVDPAERLAHRAAAAATIAVAVGDVDRQRHAPRRARCRPRSSSCSARRGR